jgi:CTP:molybdopterin cytidylyltransferase MocA
MNDFKPLMKFGGLPYVLNIILKLYRHCNRVHVVTGYRTEDIKETLTEWFDRQSEKGWFDRIGKSQKEWSLLRESVNYIYHPNYEQGMFSSLQAGLAHCQKTEWIIYHFVDQPHIPEAFYNSFVKQISGDSNWIQPCYQHRKGHPILLDQSLFPEILQADPSSSLYWISQSSTIKKKLWDCPYPQILQNFNSPSDLQPGG